MGASLALALRSSGATLIAVDPDTNIHQQAMQLGIINQISTYPPIETIYADLIILAAPVTVNLEILSKLEKFHDSPSVVLDLSSTKLEICQAMDKLPDKFDPIGGHPMCGKETSGLDSADANIFKGATFALTPLKRTTNRARRIASNLVKHIGSQEIWIEPTTHDQIVADTSHLPYILASTLAGITPLDSSILVGPGFKSTTRLAGSNIKMMLDILKTNRANVLNAISSYEEHLASFRTALESDDDMKLEQLMSAGRTARNQLIQLSQDGD